MRVLLATFFSFPQYGGIGTYMSGLKVGLEQLGHSVDILACDPGFQGYYLNRVEKLVPSRDIRRRVAAKHRYFSSREPELDENIRNMESARYTFEVAAKSLIAVRRYDIIHTQDIFSTIGLSSLVKNQVPIIQTIHGSVVYETLLSLDEGKKHSSFVAYLTEMEKLSVESSEMTITPSEWLKKMVMTHTGSDQASFTVIPNGVNMEEFLLRMQEPISCRTTSSEFVISCVGRFGEIKGQQRLLQALCELRELRSDFVCWLIGDGPIHQDLESVSHQLGLRSHVQFFGERTDVPALLKHTDILVIPSLVENCPYVLIEAQVAGKAVVAFRVGGIPEFIQDDVTGLTVEPGSAHALAMAIYRLLEDSELRHSIEQNCTAVARERWSMERLVASVEKRYVACKGK